MLILPCGLHIPNSNLFTKLHKRNPPQDIRESLHVVLGEPEMGKWGSGEVGKATTSIISSHFLVFFLLVVCGHPYPVNTSYMCINVFS